jgi:hypothetical protein
VILNGAEKMKYYLPNNSSFYTRMTLLIIFCAFTFMKFSYLEMELAFYILPLGFPPLFYWVNKKSRLLTKIDLAVDTNLRDFTAQLCKEYNWQQEMLEGDDVREDIYIVSTNETSAASWGECITFIKNTDGVYVNSSVKGGTLSLGKNGKNIEKIKTYINEYFTTKFLSD